MNLHAIVSGAIGAVNPPMIGDIQPSAGYATAADGKQKPVYGRTIRNVPLQVQPLSPKDLKQLDGLNVQGPVDRAVYFNGNLQGENQAAGRGGDLIIFGCETWLVTVVLETWDSAGWCKVGVTRQLPG